MKLKQCELSNFGSYSNLKIDFSDLGLALVHGPTGSGKSTLQDAPCWILFGQTSKGGAVDEIRSWKSLNASTKGCLEVEVNGKTLIINRIRGKQGQNDLYWLEDDEIRRGKDLVDTQKLLESRIGISYEEYTTSSYFHEFSECSNFFTAKAQDRRALFEKLTDLSLAEKLAAQCKITKSNVKKELDHYQKQVASNSGKLEQILLAKEDAETRSANWTKSEYARINLLSMKALTWENARKDQLRPLQTYVTQYVTSKIETKISEKMANEKCSTCGSLKPSVVEYIAELRSKQAKYERYQEQIENLEKQQNPYSIADKSENPNPFEEQIESFKSHIALVAETLEAANIHYTALEAKYAALERLYDLCASLRGELLKKAVKSIEWDTNGYLEKYFDSELKVEFQLGGSDSLHISLQKSGYNCTYKQLSKGQRGLLRLCFSAAIMKASANNKGQHFDNIFMDEALDGLDTALKLKAFRLFESLSLEHSSVMIIDHCEELHSLFSKKYRVSIENDESQVEIEES